MNFEDFLPRSVFRLSGDQPLSVGSNKLDSSALRVTITKSPKPVPAPESATTKTFTDHMVFARWTATSGWNEPEIVPYGPLSLPPSASVLHYATACFEGLKAYRGHDGRTRLFRPQFNCARMLASAARISLPGFDPDELLELIRKLCALDGPKWLPKNQAGSSIYIRPTLIGVDDSLGFQAPQEAILVIIMSYWPNSRPSGRGLRLLASDSETIRAWPGGSGSAKLAANYGPSILAHSHAKRKDCDQVLWLFGPDGEVTEAGSANFFAIWRTAEETLQLVTPGLAGHTILPGVTRQSVLDLARERLSAISAQRISIEPVEVLECKFTIYDIAAAAKEGRLVTSFATGTAASIVPISEIHFDERKITIESSMSPHLSLLQKWMADITCGSEQSTWTEAIIEESALP